MLAMVERTYGMTDERADWHLWNWSQWMHSGNRSLVSRGYPERASGGLRGNGTTGDFDDECRRVDVRCARATDAAVYALPEPLKVAVLFEHGLIRMHGLRDIEAYYEQACERIARELTRRGID